MQELKEGQCGLCLHFGDKHSDEPKLVQIRTDKSAPQDLIDECGHPRHADLNLLVTPISGCDGFTPATASA